MRHIVPISGKDSLATALLLRELYPHLPLEYVHNAVGAETPEVEAWLQRVEQTLGIAITRIGVNLERLIENTGMLPSVKARYCTRQAKIEPMEKWIGTDAAYLYLGIRADEKRIGYEPRNKRLSIIPRYPLQDAGITIDGVWAMVDAADLAPPQFAWERLQMRVSTLLGADGESLVASLSRADSIALFAGRSRPNCYFCFFQSAHEWAWLFEQWPELFERAAQMEESIGGDGYTWRQGESLRDLAQRADAIFERRAQRVAALIRHGSQQRFDFADDDGALLRVVSCGLFCGK
jgi:hypothetical protein